MNDKPPLRLNLHADALAAVFMAKSMEETRYYLNGVYVTPWTVGEATGVMMVATDGRIMATYFDSEGEANRAAIIDGAFSQSLLKTGSGEKAPRRLICEGDIGRVTCVRSAVRGREAVGLSLVREVGGSFPDWQKPMAFKHGSGASHFWWSHLIIDRVCRIAHRLNGPRTPGVSVWHPDPNGPALFTFGKSCPLTVVAMPMVGHETADSSQGYAATKGQPAEAAEQPDATLAAE